MSHIVLWSGGMDSTLLVNRLAINNPTEMINAVTIEGIGFKPEQAKAELLARKRLLEEWKKRKLNNIQHYTINVNNDIKDEGLQMRMWFCYIMPSLRDGDKLHMAYLSSDGYTFFSMKEKFIEAFNKVCELRDIKCELLFDMEGQTKGDIIEGLKITKLTKFTSYCGMPKKNLKPCGKCMKCMSVKRWKANGKSGIYT